MGDGGEFTTCVGGAAATPEERDNEREQVFNQQVGDAGGEEAQGFDADAMDEDEWEEEEGEYDDEDDDEEEEEEDEDKVGDSDDNSNDDRDAGSGGRAMNYSRMNVDDMWYRAFDCERIFRTVRPIHNESTWTFLRGVYVGVMMTASGAEQVPQQEQYPDSPSHGNRTRCRSDQLLCNHGPTISLLAPLGSGFRKAVQAKQTDDGKGRGVYAAEPIRKGELVWTATASTARFPSGALYRQFLAIIPADLACDVLQWAYVQDVAHFYDSTADNLTDAMFQSPPQRMLRVSVDLDEGSYMNGEDYDPNVGCLPEDEEEVESDGADETWSSSAQPTRTPSQCQQNFFALRDIREGEELLCPYGDFANSDGWKELGL